MDINKVIYNTDKTIQIINNKNEKEVFTSLDEVRDRIIKDDNNEVVFLYQWDEQSYINFSKEGWLKL